MTTFLIMALKGPHCIESQHERKTTYQGNANLISKNFEGKQKKSQNIILDFPSFLFVYPSFWAPDRGLQHVYSFGRACMWTAPVLKKTTKKLTHRPLTSPDSCGANKSTIFIFFYFVFLSVLEWTIPFILLIYIFFLYSWKKMIWRNMSRVWAHYYDLFMVKLNKNPKNSLLLFFAFFDSFQLMANSSMEPLCCRVFSSS